MTRIRAALLKQTSISLSVDLSIGIGINMVTLFIVSSVPIWRLCAESVRVSPHRCLWCVIYLPEILPIMMDNMQTDLSLYPPL